MFTGIIEELGKVRKIKRCAKNILLEIEAAKVLDGTAVGDSISVNGACLTVIEKGKDSLSFEVIPETLRMSNLGLLHPGEEVNLERSLKIGDRVSGHFVSGHVDCTGTIRKKNYKGNNLAIEVVFPAGFMKYCLPKGSVSVDGISLTLAACVSNTFTVYIIPHTFKNTTLGFKGPSAKVNIEFDILAKRT